VPLLVGQMAGQFAQRIDLKADMPRRIESEPLKVFLFRAVQEILFNEVKHSGVDEAKVAIAVSDDWIIAEVSDEGRGFDPNLLNTLNAKAGIGLLSLRELTQHIGGYLKIKSASGKGSRFILTLSLNISAEDRQRGSTIGNQTPDAIIQ
jgi:signal transduction histidine kinase